MTNEDRKGSSANEVLIPSDLNTNIENLKAFFANCQSIVFRRLYIESMEIHVIFSDNSVDNILLNEGILKNLVRIDNLSIDKIINELPIGNVRKIKSIFNEEDKIFSGEVLIVLEGCNEAVAVNIPKYSETSESEIEPSILGNKEAFTNILSSNIALLSRYIPNHNLKFKALSIGRLSNTNVAVAHIDNIANEKVVDEIVRRIEGIDIDMIIDSTNIAELIEDCPYSPFPTINMTERIDKAIGVLKEGQVVIMVDKTPFVLIAPAPFQSFFKATEDYYNSFYISTFIRYLRYLCYFMSIFIPGIYVAIINYNQELLPLKVLITLTVQRRTLPFPPIVEILLMLIAFELLRELGMRLPKTIGSTVSLVGALLIGETAVRAGIVSATVVIISALTSIAAMIAPSILLYESVVVCRMFCLLISSIFGYFGVLLSIAFILGHIVKIRTFGIPYTYPISPYISEDMDDVLLRAPLWEMDKRPLFFSKGNKIKFRRYKK